MTTAELLEVVLPRWRAKMSRQFSPAALDGFVRRNRAALEKLVARALAERRAACGALPETSEEFAAYDRIVARERPRDSESDEAILTRLLKRIDELFAEGYRELLVLRNIGSEFIDTRAEAILLRKAGWDSVPLLPDRPALAFVIAGAVMAVRDSMGGLAIHPDRRGKLNHLHFDVNRAEQRITELHEAIAIAPDTKERLQRFAKSLWRHARAA